MAITWTSQNLTDIAEVLGTNSRDLSDYLDFFSETISATDQTAVLASVVEYQAVESNDVSIEPKERNFGARINSGGKRQLIKARIASLLHWEMSSSSSLVRG